MSTLVDDMQLSIQQAEFRNRVVEAANNHMRISEPTWDLYDVKVTKQQVVIDGVQRIAVTMYFKDNGLGF